MKFNINNYKGNYVMHCKTEEEARKFCNYLHSIGRKWGTEYSYLDYTHYGFYEDETAYAFNEGCYSPTYFYEEHNYTILEFSDFDWEFTKADLKTGDVILKRNGSVEIVNRDLEMLICQNGGWNNLDDIQEDLTYRSPMGAEEDDEDCDIIQVRRPQTKRDCCFNALKYKWGELVYKREEPEEMTLEQVCKLLGKKIKIIG